MTVPDFASHDEAEKYYNQLTGELAQVVLVSLGMNIRARGFDLMTPLAKQVAGRSLHAALSRLLCVEGQAYVSEN